MKREQRRGRVRHDARRGKWVADWRDESFQRTRRTFKTRSEAEAYLTSQIALRDRIKCGEAHRESALTVLQLLEARLRELDLRGTSSSHREGTDRTFKQFRSLVDHERRAEALKPADLDLFLASRKKQGASVATLRLQTTHIRSAYAWAKRSGLLTKNSLAEYRTPRPADADRRKKRRVLTEQEIQKFLQAVEEEDRRMIGDPVKPGAMHSRWVIPQRPLFAFLITVGSRWTETIKLRWYDVRDGKARFRAETRKRKTEREPFPLPEGLQEDLRKLRDLQARGLGRVPGPEDRVFLSPLGHAWDAGHTNGLRLFYRLLKKAGIKKKDLAKRTVDIHSLKATACVRFLREGVPHALVARLLGTSPEVILKHYARPSEDDLREAVCMVPDLANASISAQNKLGKLGARPAQQAPPRGGAPSTIAP